MLIYTHADCLLHNPGAGHPESPHRLAAVLQAIADLGLNTIDAPVAERADLLRAHDPALVEEILSAPEHYRIDADTMMSPASKSAALRACGAGIAAVRAVLQGPSKRAFCAVRPPGHHASHAHAMGFCLFNAVAVAAHQALALGLQRVSIIDFDVHHGNGTQDIFANEPRVQYLSTHQSPLYPGTGDSSEMGCGNIVNAPLPPGSSGREFRTAINDIVLPAIAAFQPELLLISAGFDAHYLDPLAGLKLQTPDYAWVTAELVQSARGFANGRVVSMLEGGYSATALYEGVSAHLQALSDH